MTERVPGWPTTDCTTKHAGGVLLHCSTRSCSMQHHFREAVAAAKVRTWAGQQGWMIDKKWKEAVCPQCRQARDQERKVSDQSQQASKAEKMTWALLFEHYDDEGCCYHEGWSDSAIAKKVGMSADFVAAIRDKHFGPAENPEVGQVLVELGEARSKLHRDMEDVERLAVELETKIADVAQRLTVELESKIADLRTLAASAKSDCTAKLNELGTRVARLRGA
jgi:hypothetical protein